MPYFRTTIETERPLAEVRERLEAVVRPPRPLFELPTRRRSPDPCAFEGEISGDSFKIQRDIRYRNSFLPVVRGRLEEAPRGTRVAVRMTLHPLVAAFIAFWLVGVAVFAVGTGAPLAIVMLLFGGFLVCGAFYAEVAAASSSLRRELGDRAM